MARKKTRSDWDDLPTIRRCDDIAPIVVNHASIDANAKLLLAYARSNVNDAAHRFGHQNGGSTMTNIHDGGGAPARNAEETAI